MCVINDKYSLSLTGAPNSEFPDEVQQFIKSIYKEPKTKSDKKDFFGVKL